MTTPVNLTCPAPETSSWGGFTGRICGNQIVQPKTGRTKKYCSDACRGAAFRQRRDEKDRIERQRQADEDAKWGTVTLHVPRAVVAELRRTPGTHDRWRDDRFEAWVYHATEQQHSALLTTICEALGFVVPPAKKRKPIKGQLTIDD